MTDPIVPSAVPATPPAAEPQNTPPVVPPVVPQPKVVEEEKYKAAVREMNLKQQESALLRKELDLMKQQLNGMQPINQPASNYNQEPPEHIKKQLEAKFNMPYEHIALMNQMLELKNGDIKAVQEKVDKLNNVILEERYENTKSRMKSEDPIFDEFAPEFEARMNMLPIERRTDKSEIAKIKAEVVSDHLNEIIKMAEDRGRSSVTVRPPTPPEVNSPGGGTPNPTSPKITHLTAEQKEFIARSGGDVQAVEEFVNGKKKSSSRWGSYAE